MMIGCLPSWHSGASSCSTASHEKLLPIHKIRRVSLFAHSGDRHTLRTDAKRMEQSLFIRLMDKNDCKNINFLQRYCFILIYPKKVVLLQKF
jgi:hypothetical protein